MRTAIKLDLQIATDSPDLPAAAFFKTCVAAVLRPLQRSAVVTVRLVSRAESRALNRRWRGHDRATNVLSFPVQGLQDIAPDLLGDVVICAPLVVAEAAAQAKAPAAHWAHLTVHGVLHLVGFDHEQEKAAAAMEDRERAILSGLGYPDPYRWRGE